VCVVALMLTVGTVAGCEHAAPTAPVTLPEIQRPVITIDARGANTRLLVPTIALVERGGIPGVFVLQEAAVFPPPARGADGKALPQARFRMVKTGKTSGSRVEILSGLAGDETLVLGALSDVHDGSPVMVKR
jgi:multidrug efflux pump subunit AcrA (membrane-fusion protein)